MIAYFIRRQCIVTNIVFKFLIFLFHFLSLIFKLKISSFSLSFSFSKSSGVKAVVVGTAKVLVLSESTVFAV